MTSLVESDFEHGVMQLEEDDDEKYFRRSIDPGERDNFLHNHHRVETKALCGLSFNYTFLLKAMIFINAILAIVLIISISTIFRSTTVASYEMHLPFSPALEALVPTKKKFKPNPLFQKLENDESDAAWEDLLKYDTEILLTPDVAAKMEHESIEAYWKLGHYIYAISMFHQLHCLNRIRQAFSAERYFPTETDEAVHAHTVHCFDFLRQAIVCNGDVSMVYWWNKDFYQTAPDGTEVYSDRYLNMTLREQLDVAWLNWDITHQCYDFSSIDDWARRHGNFIVPDKPR